MTNLTGLTEAEAQRRRAQGMGNAAPTASSRTLGSILRANFLSGFNLLIYALGLGLIAMGLVSDGLFSVSMILLNGIVGAAQEIRAKRTLDKIALLTRPHVQVIRDGSQKQLSPEEVVRGDVIQVQPGDQIVVDGPILDEGRVEVDESLLTGESRPVFKTQGERLLSGSFCIRGTARMEAEKVGIESYANQLAVAARNFRIVVTPMQRDVNRVLHLMIGIALSLGLLTLFSAVVNRVSMQESLQALAVIAGVVPTGLVQSILLAYLLGAVRIAGKGVLVQQANSVESMSAVTVLCMDKTGTLTANRLQLDRTISLVPDADRLLGDFAASIPIQNKTSAALAQARPGTARTPTAEIPFSSELKWSGLAFDTPEMKGSYLLGAPEVLHPHLHESDQSVPNIREWTEQGMRVLYFACHPDSNALRTPADQTRPPDGLTLLAILGFTDELRPNARETVAQFVSAGVRPCILSGDAPETVAAVARQVGLPGELLTLSGTELAEMDETEFQKAAEEVTVFGRVTPEQKERLVETLKRQGRYVAMIGDGVNDVLALKKANLGIALESGSNATRGVADIVLLENSFAGLPDAVQEGRRVVNGMQSILSLYLTRGFYTVLLILATGYIGIGFPFAPKQVSILSVLTVGLPAFGLIYWARPTPPDRPISRMLRQFVMPAALSIALFGLILYLVFFFLKMRLTAGMEMTPQVVEEYRHWAEIPYTIPLDGIDWRLANAVARAGLTHFTVIAGLFLILFLQPPVSWFAFLTDAEKERFHRKPALLAAVIGLLYGLALTFPPIRRILQFPAYPALATGLIFGMTAVWIVSLRFALKYRLLERLWHPDSPPALPPEESDSRRHLSTQQSGEASAGTTPAPDAPPLPESPVPRKDG